MTQIIYVLLSKISVLVLTGAVIYHLQPLSSIDLSKLPLAKLDCSAISNVLINIMYLSNKLMINIKIVHNYKVSILPVISGILKEVSSPG